MLHAASSYGSKRRRITRIARHGKRARRAANHGWRKLHYQIAGLTWGKCKREVQTAHTQPCPRDGGLRNTQACCTGVRKHNSLVASRSDRHISEVDGAGSYGKLMLHAITSEDDVCWRIWRIADQRNSARRAPGRRWRELQFETAGLSRGKHERKRLTAKSIFRTSDSCLRDSHAGAPGVAEGKRLCCACSNLHVAES